MEGLKQRKSPKGFDILNYKNPDSKCHYHFEPDPLGYCFAWAHHVDGTKGFEDMLPRCLRCECYEDSLDYREG
jgi:hypothetical protein